VGRNRMNKLRRDRLAYVIKNIEDEEEIEESRTELRSKA
jgi:hypothetical protein